MEMRCITNLEFSQSDFEVLTSALLNQFSQKRDVLKLFDSDNGSIYGSMLRSEVDALERFFHLFIASSEIVYKDDVNEDH